MAGSKGFQSVAFLRISGDDLDPAEITRALGCEPTESQRKGDVLVGRNTGVERLAKFGGSVAPGNRSRGWSQPTNRSESDAGSRNRNPALAPPTWQQSQTQVASRPPSTT